MFQSFLLPLLMGFFLSIILTYFVIKLATKLNIVDIPRDRHRHNKPTPLMGGLAIGLSILIIVAFYFIFYHGLPGGYIQNKKLIGLIIGIIILMIGGILDDKFDLKPKYQIVFPMLAIIAVISSGIGINYITNPFGGFIRLDQIKIHLFTILGIPAFLTLFADLFTSIWLLGTTYTTKFLDGVDGLVSGITAIGTLVLGFLCLGDIVHQPDTAILCFIISGCFLGFLVFNFYPAKIFLGESGSTIAGFLLGTLAIIAGGKIAITLLILALPILDALIVIISRIFNGLSPFKGDRRHLHFKLKELGLNDKQITVILYIITIFFGGIGLMSGTKEKMITLLILTISSISMILWIDRKTNNKPDVGKTDNINNKQFNEKNYLFDVSAIIINYNSLNFLKDQLEAFSRLQERIKYEIIIVENGSKDKDFIKQIISKYNIKNLTLIISNNNLGYSGGINLGAKYSNGKYIIPLNTDVIPNNYALSSMFDFMEEHKDIGILAPKLFYPDNTIQNSCYRFYNIFTPIFRRTRLSNTSIGKKQNNYVLMNDFDHNDTIEVDWVLGAAFMINKEFFDSIGRMDERYFLYYEDMDICKRVQLNNKKIVYYKNATMIHYHQRTSANIKNIMDIFKNDTLKIHIKSAIKYSYKFYLR